MLWVVLAPGGGVVVNVSGAGPARRGGHPAGAGGNGQAVGRAGRETAAVAQVRRAEEAAGRRVKAARVAALTKVPCHLSAVGPQDQR